MGTHSETTLALLRLSLTPGLGPRRVSALIEAFGSPVAALAASPGELERIPRIGRVTAAKIARGLRESLAISEAAIGHAADLGVRIVARGEPGYPQLLTQIPDPPTVLYVAGSLRPDDDDRYSVAIVGSRACTAYGIEQAERFAGVLAGSGLTVVSGGARGIDSAAHRGAIRNGGRTVAVLGCGLAHRYPPENERLFEQIVAMGGAVVSELPLDVAPQSENFPGRNRIISGLSLGVIVIEAAQGSGALITARAAAEDHGREVLAVPGRVDSPASEGCNGLIRAGEAALAMSPADVLDLLETPARHHFQDTHEARYRTSSNGASDETLWQDEGPRGDTVFAGSEIENRLLEGLETPRSVEELAESLDFGTSEVRATVTLLEIRGLVTRRGALIERRRPSAP